ncbi:MAG TPA: DUF2950 domain-containing protein [Nitrospirales bacterium]|jgi:hypothetical protein
MPKKFKVRGHLWRRGLLMSICVLTVTALAPVVLATSAEQTNFSAPVDGIAALIAAVKSDDEAALGAILGPDGIKLISSGDEVADSQSRETFIKAYDEGHKLVLEGDAQAVLVIGRDEWPMPIPLVKSQDGWRFDTKRGEEEVLARRIGRNELAAIQVCLAIVDAERDYAAQDPDGDGIPEYASKFVSTPGKHDGLYWETKAGEPLSPLGPLLAAATGEGYPSDSAVLAPYHGYFYRLLTQQGKDAVGGAHAYLVNGKMIGGFAVIAYPAAYGASGIMSFIANQDGAVFEKDLGESTPATASKMTTFNPDASWRRT